MALKKTDDVFAEDIPPGSSPSAISDNIPATALPPHSLLLESRHIGKECVGKPSILPLKP